jgi:hypothetical protein
MSVPAGSLERLAARSKSGGAACVSRQLSCGCPRTASNPRRSRWPPFPSRRNRDTSRRRPCRFPDTCGRCSHRHPACQAAPFLGSPDRPYSISSARALGSGTGQRAESSAKPCRRPSRTRTIPAARNLHRTPRGPRRSIRETANVSGASCARNGGSKRSSPTSPEPPAGMSAPRILGPQDLRDGGDLCKIDASSVVPRSRTNEVWRGALRGEPASVGSPNRC